MTEEKQALASKIKNLVVRRFASGIDPSHISADRSLFEFGVGVDSVSTLEFIMELENEFGISIDESEVGPEVLENIDSLCEFIVSFEK